MIARVGTPWQSLESIVTKNKITISRGTVTYRALRCFATVAPGNQLPLSLLVTQSVRTRFAPSPTGKLHLGSLRTALFNYLLAKHYNGQFILRIEDTDRNRTVDGAVEGICRLLEWAGIRWDEGPGIGGVQGPYQQSERLKIYKGLADCLIDSGKAYRCFCSSEKLEEVRVRAHRAKQEGSYDRRCHYISPEESRQRAKNNEPHVVRMLSPDKWPVVNDLLRGCIGFPTGPLKGQDKYFFEDAILLKSDGWPTYHLACVVDDHLMEISHVIRGEEWLPSTPKHLVLYEAFGWEPPAFIHLPLLHSMSGEKLSKRSVGSDMSFHIEDYRTDGILPEALVNYVALFGWSAKSDSDVYTMDQLIAEFSVDGLSRRKTKVSSDKLPFLNHQHILKKLSSPEGTESLVDQVMPFLVEKLSPSEYPSKAYLAAVLKVSQERMHTLKDVYDAGPYFFRDPDYSSKKLAEFRKRYSQELIDEVLTTAWNKFHTLSIWEADPIFKSLKEIAERANEPSKVVMQILRYALAGLEPGVGVPVIIEILGKDTTLRRLVRAGIDQLPSLDDLKL